MTDVPWSPGEPARLAERLNGAGMEALAGLSDGEILVAWEETVAAFLDPGSAERREIQDGLVRNTRLSPAGLEAGLEAVLGGARGEPAARLFAEARELRSQASLDVGARPGFALVILSSNLPALAVQPLLPALAARRPVLLKSPTAEPLFAPAFVRDLVRRLPALAPAVAALTWRGGDAALEAPLLERAGAVLAYGDDETVAGASATALASALTDLGISRLTPPGDLQHPDALWHNGGVSPLAALIAS